MRNRYLAHARISEAQFRGILRLWCADVGALTASKLGGVNKNTTHRIYGLLRARVVELAEAESAPFTGSVEVDESYFGPRRIRGLRGRGAGRKVAVIGLLKRGGKVFCSPVMDCSKAELMPILKGNVLSQSDIYTDGWKAYDGLVTSGFKHHRVHHHENEFARGKNHVNGIESFWSFAKHRFLKLHGIRKDKFLLHLKECEFRWNHRHDNLYLFLLNNLRQNPLSAT